MEALPVGCRPGRERRKPMRTRISAIVGLAALLAAARVPGQTPTPPPNPTPTPAPSESSDSTGGAKPFRPIEGVSIINLPSVDVSAKGTLSTWFTHRFRVPVQGSDIHDLFSLDDGADIGIGIGYAPIQNLDFTVYRS